MTKQHFLARGSKGDLAILSDYADPFNICELTPELVNELWVRHAKVGYYWCKRKGTEIKPIMVEHTPNGEWKLEGTVPYKDGLTFAQHWQLLQFVTPPNG